MYTYFRTTFVLILVIFFSFQKTQAQSQEVKDNIQKLVALYQLIDYAYIDSVEMTELVDKAIIQTLKELDPHSSFIPKKEVERTEEPLRGSFEGIGITFQIFKDTILVIAPIPGGQDAVVSVEWTVPDTTSPIDIYVVIDPDLEQEDRNLSNNSVNFQVLAPDIVVREVTIQRAGFTHIVTARIANEGVLPCINFEVEIRRDDPNEPVVLDGRHIFEINPGTYNDVSFALTDLPFGVVEASIEVDSTSGVDEFDEDNNIRDIRIENYAPADFNLSEDVDIVDLSVIAQQWLSIGDDLSADISPLFIGDGKVDLEDFAEFGKYWMIAE